MAQFFLIVVASFLFLPVPASASDLEIGKQFYQDQGCVRCHTRDGKGGKFGPDLLNTQKNRDREWLTAFLKDPKKTLPGAKMMAVKGTDAQIEALVSYLLSEK